MPAEQVATLNIEPSTVEYARLSGAGARWSAEVVREPLAAGPICDVLPAALIRLARRARVAGPVLLVVPPHLLLLKHLRPPCAGRAPDARELYEEAAKAIPGPLQDSVWDVAAVSPRGARAGAVLFAARLRAVEELCAAAAAAGFEPVGAVPATLAAVASARAAGVVGEAGGVVVLVAGSRAHEILLLEPEDWAARVCIDSGRGVAPEEWARRAAAEVGRTLARFRSLGQTRPPRAVWLAHSEMPSPVLAAALAAQLALPVEPCPPGLIDRHVGAAVLAGMSAEHVADLLPSARRRSLQWRRRRPWLAGAAALALLAWWPAIAHHRSVAIRAAAEVARLDVQLAPARAREAQDRAIRSRLNQVQRRLDAIDALELARGAWTSLLADLELRLAQAEDAWLDSLELAWPGGAEPAEDAPFALAVSGRLLDRDSLLGRTGSTNYERARELFARLGESPFVAAVQRERLRSAQRGTLRFDCELVLKPAGPLVR